jgi:hypothetical protein
MHAYALPRTEYAAGWVAFGEILGSEQNKTALHGLALQKPVVSLKLIVAGFRGRFNLNQYRPGYRMSDQNIESAFRDSDLSVNRWLDTPRLGSDLGVQAEQFKDLSEVGLV